MKKLIKILISFLFLLVIAAIAVPYFFKGTLVTQIKKAVNDNVNAEFDFADANVSLLSGFPNLELNLEGISLKNLAPFAGDTLFYADEIALSMPLKSLFKKEGEAFALKALEIHGLKVNVLTNEDGKVNYDISKSETESVEESDPSETGANFKLDLQSFVITDGGFKFSDKTSAIVFALKDLQHSSSGDLSLSKSELITKTTAFLSMEMDGVEYFNNNELALDANIGVDLENNKYTFLKNEARINQLKLKFDGFVQLLENGQEMDLELQTLKTDFSNFLDLIPKEYSGELDGVKTTGDFIVEGKVKGSLTDTSIPHFDIRMHSDNASFKYPDLPKEVKAINILAAVVNTTGKTEDTEVKVDTLSFAVDKDVFGAKMFVEHLTENPLIDAGFKGKIDLGNLANAYPFPIEKDLMKGVLELDLKSNFDLKSIEEERYANTKNSGKLVLYDMVVAPEELPNPVNISKAHLNFNNEMVDLKEFRMKTGSSDVVANGKINNILGAFFNDEILKGNFSMESEVLDVSDFETMASEEEHTEELASEENKEEPFKIPGFLDMNITGSAKKVVYDNIELKDVKADLIVKDEKVQMNDLSAALFGGRLKMDGFVNTQNEKPEFNMGLGIDNFEIADSFKQLDLLKALAPVAGIVDGLLNSDMKISGLLNQDLTPDLQTISGMAVAKLLTRKIETEKSPLLSGLASNLKGVDLQKLSGKEIATAFSFEAGKVTVKPFHLEYNDIGVDISGSHGFDQSLDYSAKFDIPARYLGEEASGILSGLAGDKASSMTIPVTANIGGTITKPVVKTDMESAVSNLSKQLLASQKEKIKEEGTKQVTNTIKDLLGTKKDNTDSTTAKTKSDLVEEKASNLLNNLFGKKKKDTVN